MKIKKGDTRIVVLTKNYAVKIPKFYNTNQFYGNIYTVLTGWLANRNEHLWYKAKIYDFLCPVKASLFFSFIIVMKRTEPISKKEFESIKKYNFGGYEHKICSYGKLNEKIVIVDYGDYNKC